MNKGIKVVIKTIVLLSAVVLLFLIGYTYKGPIRDNGTISLGAGIIVLLILLFSYKIDSLQNKIIDLELKLNQYKNKDNINKLTNNDFILKEYAWVKISNYALTKDNILIRYDKDKTGFPFYQCLYQGYWEATDIGISYQDISKAKPITEEQAKKIISKEEKPTSTRPPERNNWIS